MYLLWRKTRQKSAKFMGAVVQQTMLHLVACTGYGDVALRIKIAWDLPHYDFTRPDFPLSMLPTSNLCCDFSVKMPLAPAALLGVATLEYFDGKDRSISHTPHHALLHCSSKWYRSTNRVLNRWPTRKQNMDEIREFMQRRMRNAYGKL